MTARTNWFRSVCALAAATFVLGLAARGTAVGESTQHAPAQDSRLAPKGPLSGRFLYAVNQAAGKRGSISVYDIDKQHRLERDV